MVSPSRRANPWGTPVRQVGVACATRHDIPHRTHHQRVWPGGSGRRVRCPRMSGANSAVSNGRTIRAGIPASGGPGLGSTSPHVSREPRPVGTGLFGGGGPCAVVVGVRRVPVPSMSCGSLSGWVAGGMTASGPPLSVPAGRGQGVGTSRAAPHGPAVAYFPPPPWSSVRAFNCRVEGLQPARRHLQEKLGGAE